MCGVPPRRPMCGVCGVGSSIAVVPPNHLLCGCVCGGVATRVGHTTLPPYRGPSPVHRHISLPSPSGNITIARLITQHAPWGAGHGHRCNIVIISTPADTISSHFRVTVLSLLAVFLLPRPPEHADAAGHAEGRGGICWAASAAGLGQSGGAGAIWRTAATQDTPAGEAGQGVAVAGRT